MANIMIVDDSPIIRRSLREILEAMGHRVVAEAGEGREAIELYAKRRVDLVTMDIQLPGMSGIEAVRHIRELHPHANIIMISSMEQRGTVYDAIKLGAKHYILKPYTDDKVHEVVGAVLGTLPGKAAPDPFGLSAAPEPERKKEQAPRFAKERAPLELKALTLAALPFELVQKDGRIVLTLQRHINENNVHALYVCLQGLLYYRKAKYVLELWEPIVHDVGERLLHEFIAAVRARQGTVAVVTGDPGYYTRLTAKLAGGVFRSYADIKW